MSLYRWCFTYFIADVEQKVADEWIGDGGGLLTASEFITRFWPHNSTPGELPEGAKYIRGQLERCGETGRLHWQGWIAFTRKRRLNGAKRAFAGQRVHLEGCRGNIASNDAYTWKDDTAVKVGDAFCRYEAGQKPEEEQGRRSDLEAVREALEAGATEATIATEHFPCWVRYPGVHRRWRNMVARQRARRAFGKERLVLWLHGPTGSGKSTIAGRVYESRPDVYWHAGGGGGGGVSVWFDDYDGEPVAIWDEFTSVGRSDMGFYLNLFDKWIARLNVKGQRPIPSAVLVWVITSNLPVDQAFAGCDPRHLAAMQRRCEEHEIRDHADATDLVDQLLESIAEHLGEA